MARTKVNLPIWVFGVAILITAIDQIAKVAAIAYLKPNVSNEFLGSVVKLYLIRNDSAAFSMGFGMTWIFTIISSAAVITCAYFAFKVANRTWAVLLGALMGGVAGNLIDRLFREPGFPNGHVVDFIQIPFNFPIFNLADTAICVVAALAVIRVVRGDQIGGGSNDESAG